MQKKKKIKIKKKKKIFYLKSIIESRIEVSVSVSIYTYFKISTIYREVYLFISKNLVYL